MVFEKILRIKAPDHLMRACASLPALVAELYRSEEEKPENRDLLRQLVGIIHGFQPIIWYAPCEAIGDAVLKVREAVSLAEEINAEALPAVQEDIDHIATLLEAALPFIKAAAGMKREGFAGDYFAGYPKEDAAGAS
ncbi:MAG: hypothetical protein QF511_12025 [Rhodospirillales bacterium]|nr:hypothetical protein [Rhodospirillales bacterium]MDP7216314.1 hypothetical protein [Rhodospirillales bacterium]HIJ42404.1 hypothetical protein [Rhodospirillaceae bacterium]HIJ91964.1 hypothetical protein [Rhodospirillaceae bacterium]HJP53655.1 hypothetical protein [Rhodospirillales bacterium]